MMNERAFMFRKMKNVFHCLCLFFLLIELVLFADKYADEVYAKIPDICHPTFEDYQMIQNYLNQGHRPLIDRLNKWQYYGKAINFGLIGRTPDEHIEHGVVCVNCDSDYKQNCIVLYASFNFEYPKVLKALIENIKKSYFKGHILYRIGGWPDIEGGGLRFAHIPCAFKICAFREAQRLGYQNVLWLDASVTPLQQGLNKAFTTIEQQGYFTFLSDLNMASECNKEACEILGLPFAQAASVPGYVSGIVGFNLKNPNGLNIINRWYEVTKNHEECYFTYSPDLCVISILLYQAGLTNNLHWKRRVTWNKAMKFKKGMQFFINKYAVQPDWPN